MDNEIFFSQLYVPFEFSFSLWSDTLDNVSMLQDKSLRFGGVKDSMHLHMILNED